MKDTVGWCDKYEVLFRLNMMLEQMEKANQGASNCPSEIHMKTAVKTKKLMY